MTLYMLDTNIVSYLLRGHAGVARKITSVSYSDLCLSSITEAELLYGLELRPEATSKARIVREFLSRIASRPWDSIQAARYGELKATMQRSGKRLEPIDMLIAAHALSLGATLVTNDRAFRHVPGLALEDWS